MDSHTLLLNFFTAISLLSVIAEFGCNVNAMPIVRSISEVEEGNFGLPGLSHVTLAGFVRDSTKEVEVWLSAVSPGSASPIHRHACEEILVVLKGSATLYLADSKFPSNPKEFHFSGNSTVYIPPNEVHQIVNTNEHEDLQALVVISRPPMKAFIYDDWSMPHTAAKLKFPIFWDEKFYDRLTQVKDEL